MSVVAAAVAGSAAVGLYGSYQQGKQADQAAGLQAQALAQQNAIAEREVAMAEDQYAYYKDTYRPMEEEIVANAGLSSSETQEMVAGAGLTAINAFDSAQASRDRNMQRMGINPNSSAYGENSRKSAISRAVAKANAQNNARDSAKNMDYTQKVAAVGLGKGLTNNAAALMSSASNSYGQAANGYGLQAQMYGQSAANMANLGIQVAGAGLGANGSLTQFGNNLIGNYGTNGG